MYMRIVVPLDGSTLAERALPEAEWMARLAGAPIHLVRVVDLTQLPWYGQFGLGMEYLAVERNFAADRDAATGYLRSVAERLTEAGLTVEVDVMSGQTSRALVSATRPGDLLVMASHGRSGVSRWFLGSVAEETLRHAQVPILLVKAGEQATPTEPAEPALAAAG